MDELEFLDNALCEIERVPNLVVDLVIDFYHIDYWQPKQFLLINIGS